MALDASPERPNLILLLGLDPVQTWTVDDVRSRLGQAKREWNKLKNGVGPRSNEAKHNLDILKRLDTAAILATEKSLNDHVVEAREAHSKRQEADKAALKEEIQFAAIKGYLLPAEIQDLRNRYEDRLTPDDLEACLRGYTTALHESREALSTLTLDQIDELLAALDKNSLYSFLGLPENASLSQLVRAADEKAEDARKRPPGDLKYVQQKELAGHARSVFANDSKRAQYDEHDREARFIRSVFAPYISLCDLSKEITLPQAEYLLERARKAKWSETDAQQLIFTVAVSRGWRVQVPASRRAETTAAQQRVVDELKKALNEVRERAKLLDKQRKNAEDKEQQARDERDSAKRELQAELDKAKRHGEQRQHEIEDLERRAREAQLLQKQLEAGHIRDRDQLAKITQQNRQLHIELQQERDRQRAEEQARVAEFGPRLAIHMTRSELIAAQAIIRSFLHVPQQWKDDERRIATDIPDAVRLLEAAKRAAASDPHHAEQLVDAALSKCADLEAALEFRHQLPPAPPSDLQVGVDGYDVTLSWTPSPSRNVQYVVVRKEGSKPTSVYDGDHVGNPTATRWRDETPLPARPLWYSVYAKREETLSITGASAMRALFLLPDVADLRCDVAEGRITLQWQSPRNASDIIVVRREETAPRGFDDGRRYELGHAERFEDSDVRNGVHYFYRVYCEYLDAAYATHHSEGKMIDAIPEPPPQEVPALDVRGSQGLLNHTVTLIAATPATGEFRVFRSDEAPNIPPSRTVPMHALQTVFGRTGRPLSEMRDILFSAARAFYTPVVLFHDTAFLGEPREYSYGPRLMNVRTEIAEQSIRVRWKWSYGSEGAEVFHSPSGIPATNSRVDYVPHTDRNEDDPYCELRGLARGNYDIAVRARYRVNGHAIVSDVERASVHLGGPLVIRYAVRAQNRVFGNKQYRIVLSASEPLPYSPPPCVVVRSEGVMPTHPGDGEIVPISAPQRPDDGTWVIPLDGFVPGPTTSVAVFPAAGQPYDIHFVPESPAGQRIQ